MQNSICAQISAAGNAAITVLRISGSDAINIVAKYFTPAEKLLSSPSHRLIHGIFNNAQGKPIDEVLLSVFRAPHSYTGENSVEISCHGNPNLAGRIMECLLLHARMAKPGEFTLRAYLNGKLDLSQAEAVNDLISAKASKAESAALMQLQGVLGSHLQGILARIGEARLRCELAIDFADQDLPQIDLNELHSRIAGLIQDITALTAKGEQGRCIREGIKICLAGAPNAGKSSLFNALLQQNRAIVTPHPGTTRDYLEESISLNGFPLVIYDTAGLRSSLDEAESAGIAKSYELMQTADIIIYLIDASQGTLPGTTDIDPNYLHKTIRVYSKADLLPASQAKDGSAIYCSVVHPDGLTALSSTILNKLMLSEDILNEPLATNSRHLAALAKSKLALTNAKAALEDNAGYEFIAFELISAANALEEILGTVSTDEMLENIFSNFCIGK
jgi:tRNA modification GTPase